MFCPVADMTVAFGKYFIRNEAKKREKQYGKIQKLTQHNASMYMGGNAKQGRKREANESSEKRHGVQSPFEFSFGSKADFAISNFHHRAGSVDSQSSGRMDLGNYREEYRYVRQTISSSYLAHITRVVVLCVCVCVCLQAYLLFSRWTLFISFFQFSGTHPHTYKHTNSWTERHIITHRRISPWSAFLWFDKSVRST